MADCTRAAIVDWIGAPCPECGHTTLAHPGPTNPALDSCALCQITANLGAVRVDLETVKARVDELRPDDVELDAQAELVTCPDCGAQLATVYGGVMAHQPDGSHIFTPWLTPKAAPDYDQVTT